MREGTRAGKDMYTIWVTLRANESCVRKVLETDSRILLRPQILESIKAVEGWNSHVKNRGDEAAHRQAKHHTYNKKFKCF